VAEAGGRLWDGKEAVLAALAGLTQAVPADTLAAGLGSKVGGGRAHRLRLLALVPPGRHERQ
jgi:hypothetical protein